MSAIVCGKRSFFEEMETAGGSSPTSSSPPAFKKFRCSSATSPVRFTYSPPGPTDQLKCLFPDIEAEILEKILEDAGNDFHSAAKRVHELRLGYGKSDPSSVAEASVNMEKGAMAAGKDALPPKDIPIQKNMDGAEWVELFVREMKSATSIDDARSRAASVLESLEKSIRAQASAEAAESLHKENMMLKEQIELILKDNAILKRAVAIQHERQKEYDEKNQEVHQLKQLVAQYQDQLRTLEVNNYALTLHLRQAQQSNSIPGRFHPDVF